MVVGSLLFAGGFTLGFACLTLAPRWVQVIVTGAGIVLGGFVIGGGLIQLDAGGLLAGLVLLGFSWGLDALLVALRRPVNFPSARAPGGAAAPGPGGERVDGRSPSGPGVSSCETAAAPGQACAFSRGRG